MCVTVSGCWCCMSLLHNHLMGSCSHINKWGTSTAAEPLDIVQNNATGQNISTSGVVI